MSLPRKHFRLSVADYLAGERDGAVRHEYVDGQAYAMAGASARHNRIALNIAGRLNDHPLGGGCEAFMADMKIKVAPELFYYPDVVVTCDALGGNAYFCTEPRLIVEVLSPTTERTDRHEKLAAYRSCASVWEYVSVSQDRMLIELHRRRGDEWQVEILTGAEERCVFESVGLTLGVGDVYRNVRFDEAASQQES
ncbi:MAG TPA: Uma2 family endonuclease [Pyrinomonadaceae bacterium]|jgi:Uma2 family endonuclease|nr:Uma2 family endonuclease [Pyrinomonadaceae bacterium]